MLVHLSNSDIQNLRDLAAGSLSFGDAGESFAEECLVCIDDEELEAIADSANTTAEDFFLQVFASWDGEEPDGIIETLTLMLEDLDIEFTYDEDDGISHGQSDWDDDVEDEPLEFDG